MLLHIAFGVVDQDIGDPAVLVKLRLIDRVHKSLIRCDAERLIARQEFAMEIPVHLDGVGLDQFACAGIIACGDNLLHDSQQFAEEAAHSFVVIDTEVVFVVLDDDLRLRRNGVGMRQHPVGYERAVAHVRFLYIFTGFDAHQLCHRAVHELLVVLRLVRLLVGRDT